MKLKSKIIFLSSVIAMTFFCTISNAEKSLKTLYGSTRVETSIKAAKENDSKTLVIANGYKFPDLLSAYNIVNSFNGKLVLIDSNSDIEALIKDLHPERVFVIGGENSISDDTYYRIKGIYPITVRVSGANRYKTNEETLSLGGYRSVGVADGRNFADALSASGLLAKEKLGLMLVNGGESYNTSKHVVYTFGGEKSVRQSGGIRIAGTDRYKTNLKINEKFNNFENLSITSGKTFADALSALNFISKEKNSSVLLVDEKLESKKFYDEIKDFVKKSKNIYLIGGLTKWIESNVDSVVKVENAIEKYTEELKKAIDENIKILNELLKTETYKSKSSEINSAISSYKTKSESAESDVRKLFESKDFDIAKTDIETKILDIKNNDTFDNIKIKDIISVTKQKEEKKEVFIEFISNNGTETNNKKITISKSELSYSKIKSEIPDGFEFVSFSEKEVDTLSVTIGTASPNINKIKIRKITSNNSSSENTEKNKGSDTDNKTPAGSESSQNTETKPTTKPDENEKDTTENSASQNGTAQMENSAGSSTDNANISANNVNNSTSNGK